MLAAGLVLGLSVSSFLLRRGHSQTKDNGTVLRFAFLTVPVAAGCVSLPLGATLHFAMLAVVPWAVCACMLAAMVVTWLAQCLRSWNCGNCGVNDHEHSRRAVVGKQVRFSDDIKAENGHWEEGDGKV